MVVKNRTKGSEFEARYELSPRQVDIILAGGTLSYIKVKKDNGS